MLKPMTSTLIDRLNIPGSVMSPDIWSNWSLSVIWYWGNCVKIVWIMRNLPVMLCAVIASTCCWIIRFPPCVPSLIGWLRPLVSNHQEQLSVRVKLDRGWGWVHHDKINHTLNLKEEAGRVKWPHFTYFCHGVGGRGQKKQHQIAN